jgi:hypothetical protein
VLEVGQRTCAVARPVADAIGLPGDVDVGQEVECAASIRQSIL